jgi:FSR family fosmidomycin resistance protein-like MFS transporter
MQKSSSPDAGQHAVAPAATFSIVLGVSFAHLLNDMMQSLLPAIYPIIKATYHLDFGQIGLLTLAFQLTASMFQPVVGAYTDRHPQPYSLVVGMGMTLAGLVVLAHAVSFAMLLLGAGLMGTGSSIFHPESTRVARLASGGRHGFAQSLFQVGGQTGQALGPLLAAFIIVPFGQTSLSWFSVAALLAMIVLIRVGHWYKAQRPAPVRASPLISRSGPFRLEKTTALALVVLSLLMFSKTAYTSSLTAYYTFYLIGTFQVSVQASQLLLFLFLLAQAIGSLIGGHIGDRVGYRPIIWFSILGAVPFTLLMPHVDLVWTAILTVIVGMIMASAFPAILVYAMELFPGKVGMVAGMFYGVAFGLGALSAAVLGELADVVGLDAVYRACAYLPLIGLLTWILPPIPQGRTR